MGVPSSQAKRGNIKAASLLLSLSLPNKISKKKSSNKRKINSNGMFECKKCNREFASFQALGGHCTSHLRPKVRFNGIDLDIGEKLHKELPTTTSRHVCGCCGKEFLTGQALGGHMRLHRASSPGLKLSLGLGRLEEDDDHYVLPMVRDEKLLGLVVDGNVISHEGFERRLLNLFE